LTLHWVTSASRRKSWLSELLGREEAESRSRGSTMNEVRVIGVDVLTDGAGLSKVVLGGSGLRTNTGTRKHEGSRAVPNARYAGELLNNRDALAELPCLRAKIEYLLKCGVSDGDILLLRVDRFLS